MNAHQLLSLAVLGTAPLLAQLAPPNAEGVAMGHIHLAVRDVDAQKAFWTGIMGGTVVKNGPLEMIQFPGVFILLRKAEQPEPPAGSIVNHFGFVVKDMPAALAKWKANHLKVDPTENPNEAYVNAPDGIRIEVYGVPDLPVPIQMNHIHYNVSDIPGMQAWYAKVFGAKPGQRPCVACVSKPRMIQTGELPGVNLSFSDGAPGLAPTKGRSLDHIGFEVKNLEAFAKKLESQGIKLDQPVRQVPNSSVKIAFLTDPWGTYIELTEGLAPAR
ncbi:MAG TPA: VOC family protein [Bryobacteraceae bacterium]|nr:VOC family protein [Bryobacteraceae bacterium]